MKLEKYRGEFVDIKLYQWFKQVWLRPRFHIVLDGMHRYELIDMKTGYYKVVLVDKNLWKVRAHWLRLMLSRVSI